jgi:hypothetical protein
MGMVGIYNSFEHYLWFDWFLNKFRQCSKQFVLYYQVDLLGNLSIDY